MTPCNYVDTYKTVRRHVSEDRCLHKGKGKGKIRPVTCHNINIRTFILCHHNFFYSILPAPWRLLHTWFCSTAHANRLSHRPHSIKSTKRVSVSFVLFFLNKGDLISLPKKGQISLACFFHFMWKGHSLKVSSTVTRDTGGCRNIITVLVTLWS